MFCFLYAHQHKHKFEKVFWWKTRQVFFIYPFPCPLKLNHAVSIFFTQADILGEKNPYFGKPLLRKTITDYVLDFMCKTSGQVRISLLISSIT